MNLLGLHRAAACDYFVSLGEQSFRGHQLVQAIHQHHVLDVSAMHHFSNSLRARLKEAGAITLPLISNEHISVDGTIKWLMALDRSAVIEVVFIPESSRGTLCVSSQVGCALDCSFCATGKQGFNRNLTTAEIVGQLWVARRRLRELDLGQQVTNVVFMGMGEPLLNEKAVTAACDLMMDDYAYGLSKYRVTLSTSGFVPAMKRLSEVSQVSLAVSLHAANDALRDQLVPLNKKYPLNQLMEVCRHYFAATPRRKVCFEYVMLAGINDQPAHARELIRLLADVPCKINLIPFNPFPGTAYHCSSPSAIKSFQAALTRSGFVATIRRARGDDIAGACGQLAGQGEIQDLTFRTPQGRARRQGASDLA